MHFIWSFVTQTIKFSTTLIALGAVKGTKSVQINGISGVLGSCGTPAVTVRTTWAIFQAVGLVLILVLILHPNSPLCTHKSGINSNDSGKLVNHSLTGKLTAPFYYSSVFSLLAISTYHVEFFYDIFYSFLNVKHLRLFKRCRIKYHGIIYVGKEFQNPRVQLLTKCCPVYPCSLVLLH